MSEYTVHTHKYGRYIVGPLPISDMVALAKSFGKEVGKKAIMATDLCRPLGASMVLTTVENLAAWREEVATTAKEISGGDPQMEWILGPHVGQSSLSIMAVLGTTGSVPAIARLNMGTHRPIPLDVDDWNRCRRVMEVLGLKDITGMKGTSIGWLHIAANNQTMMTGSDKEIQHVLGVANGNWR